MSAPTPGSEVLSNEDLKAIRERDAAAFKAVDAYFKPCGSYDGNEVRGLLVSLFCKGWDARDTEIERLTKIEERAKEWRYELTPGSYCELSEAGIYERLTCVLEGGKDG